MYFGNWIGTKATQNSDKKLLLNWKFLGGLKMQSSCLLEFLCCYNHQQKIENNESNDVLVPKHLITDMFFAFIREIIGIMREFLFNEQKCAESEESEAKSQYIEFLALITWLMKSISGNLRS